MMKKNEKRAKKKMHLENLLLTADDHCMSCSQRHHHKTRNTVVVQLRMTATYDSHV